MKSQRILAPLAFAPCVFAMFGCSPASLSERVELAPIELRADAPSAEYSVRVCLDADSTAPISAGGSVLATLDLVGGRETIRVTGSSDDGASDEVMLSPGERALLEFPLPEQGPWAGSDSRCAETRRIRFEAPDLEEAAALRLALEVGFSLDYDDIDDVPPEDALTISVEPVGGGA